MTTATSSTAPARTDSSGLVPLLQWLDRILERAVTRAREGFASDPASDRFRGLAISDQDIDELLARSPGSSGLWYDPPLENTGGVSRRLDLLGEAFGLAPLDRAALVVAFAPEVDLRYERLYAFLQDDVTRKRPSVDLVLNLFCATPEERLAGIDHFLSDGPLIRYRLLDLVADAAAPQAPTLARSLVIDERLVGFLLGSAALDRRLVPHATLWVDEPEESPECGLPGLGLQFRRARGRGRAWRLYFHGPRGSGRRRAARAAAAAAGQPLLELSLATLPADDDAAGRLVELAVREAWLQGAVLYLPGVDQWFDGPPSARPTRLRGALEQFAGTVILGGEVPWQAGTMGITGVVPCSFGIAPVAVRSRHWSQALDGVARLEAPEILPELASRFRFTRQQIGDAVATAVAHAGPPPSGRRVILSRKALFGAARRQSGHELAELATRIEPVHSWDDLVVPARTRDQLEELCQRVLQRERVMEAWGFGRAMSRGRGINALFCGASGVGKTMAAEVVAGHLGLDLFRAELAGLVSKYIGETEKNLDRVFEAAERTDGILLFDEADALFGKRSEVRDSHDRYANLEISYLLQRMEQHDGVAILATNLRSNLDQAFVRRLAFTIQFPVPDIAQRRELWDKVWPECVPLAPDVDLDVLAERFELAGAGIRNVALASAFMAASAGTSVRMTHVLRAVRREYEKVGKSLSDEELAGAAAAPDAE